MTTTSVEKPAADHPSVAFAREQVAYYAGKLRLWEEHLADALAERGSRPGDGSDQPALFTTEPTNLFDVEEWR